MARIRSSLLAALLWAAAAPGAEAALKIFATTPDLSALAREIGGDKVSVESLAMPRQNPHFVEPKPSLIIKLMKADVLIETGLELESAWLGPLVGGSRNPKIQLSGSGRIDASEAVAPIEVPQAPTRAMGDVHPGGNPHYMTDPENVLLVCLLIAQRLSALDPENAKAFESNAEDFNRRLRAKIKEWTGALKPYAGRKYVGYHKDPSYFARRFGMESAGEIEPKPGIPPSPRHTAELIARMKAERVRLIFTHPWFESRTPNAIAQETGAFVLILALFPEEVPGTPDIISTIDRNVYQVKEALAAP
ncbi:MAG: zinc ABC transporter substrate-binding protein [Elusimicrobia bacterium]|nr:zinc ABC transporter substrate-binding protein [Elusimicrobiota bacterium]